MAVRSVTRGTIEFTEDGDVLLEVIKVNSFGAYFGATSGTVNVYSNIMKQSVNSGVWERGDPANDRLIWTSGAANASASVESAVDVDWAHGLRIEQPGGVRVVAYGE